MFNEKSFHFLENLSRNNDKKWFVNNAKSYQQHLTQPCKDLVEKLSFFMLTLDENLEINPVVNKALTTIYRDLRYSKNRKPFKTHMGINFKKKTSEWKKHPAFFFRISPEGYYFGLTIMKNNPNHFDAFRREIDRDPKKFKKVIKIIEKNPDLHIRGDDYKKFTFEGKDKSIKQFYSKKNLYVNCFRDKDHFNSLEDVTSELQKLFSDLSELYFYFSQAFLKAKDENFN